MIVYLNNGVVLEKINNHGNGIRLDHRFYIPDMTEQGWDNLDELDRMEKHATYRDFFGTLD